MQRQSEAGELSEQVEKRPVTVIRSLLEHAVEVANRLVVVDDQSESKETDTSSLTFGIPTSASASENPAAPEA